jgi:hypothetical protein
MPLNRAAASLIKDLVKSTDRKHKENTERLIHMTQAMEAHIEADARAFLELSNQILEVNKDVKSLLSSRSFLRGAWFAIGVLGTLVAAVAGALIAWFK